jgi:protocatechuate 3,4-dioxygenase beta subunit
MASQFATDLERLASRRRALGIGSTTLSGLMLAACGSGRASGQEAPSPCIATPSEIRGPFPADGTSTFGRALNILAEQGLERRDIRSSIGGLGGTAEGVELALELKVVSAEGCASLAGRAVYLWQCDARGDYSMYNREDVNYLRGLQPCDGDGSAHFTSIVPGCYGGRMPHLHLEVFENIAAATGGAPPLLVSQLAFSADACREIYADRATYGESMENLARWPGERDFLLAGDPPEVQVAQTIAMEGSPVEGYRGGATIGI